MDVPLFRWGSGGQLGLWAFKAKRLKASIGWNGGWPASVPVDKVAQANVL